MRNDLPWAAVVPVICAALAGQLHAEPFSLGTRSLEIPEAGQATYVVLNTARNEISFLPPQGWKTDVDAKAGTITWTSPDYRSMLSLKIKDDNGEQTPKLRAEELRQSVLQTMEGTKIKEESHCYTSGGSGLAFDCERVVGGGSAMSVRLAFVPLPGGVAEFNLTSPHDQSAKRQVDFGRFLNSFKVEKEKSK
jgi:hypothetical protein